MTRRESDFIGLGASLALLVRDLTEGHIVGPLILALAAFFFWRGTRDRDGSGEAGQTAKQAGP